MKPKPKFEVTVVKMERVKGTITVRALDQEGAEKRVRLMMANRRNPLQTADPRISWDDPEYVDFSFMTEEEANPH